MVPTTTLILFLFGLSGGFWIIYVLYTAIRIQWFIVKRYEIETDLMESIFFKEHATFTRAVPPFFSSAMYTAHLLMCLWGWQIFCNKKVFRDVDNPTKVLRHFSEGELRRVKKYVISSIILVIHMIALYIVDYLLPGLLK
jgi:hypothetical protein